MSVSRRKVLGDLRRDALATSLAIVVLALGTGSFVLFTASGALVRADFHHQYRDAAQPQLIVGTAGPIDEAAVSAVHELPEVEAVELLATLDTRIRTADGEWEPFEVTAVADLESWRLGRSVVVRGSAQPGAGEILVDQSAVADLGLDVGSATELQLADGRVVAVRVAGVSRQPGRAAWFEPPAFGVTTIEALSAVGAIDGPDALAIALAGPNRAFGFPNTDPLLRAIADRLAAAGATLRDVRLVPRPGETSLDRSLDGIDLVLAALGGLGLVSGALVTAAATVGAVRRQRRQVGILQAIGSGPRQLLGAVAGAVAIHLWVGIAAGVAGGLVGAIALSRYVGSLINVEQVALLPPVTVVAVQVGATVAVAGVIVLIATWRAVSTPAVANLREGSGLPDGPWRMLVRPFEHVSRSILTRMGLRNALASGAGSALIVAALGLGGGLFLAVSSVGDGLAAAAVEPADRVGYGLLAWFMNGIAAVIVSVGAIGLFARVVAGVAERRRDLAVLAAIGASPLDLARVVLHEAAGIGLLGFAGALVVWPLLAAPLGVSLGETLSGQVIVPAFGLQPLPLLAILLMTTLAAAIVPALAVMRLRVRDGLAYE